MQGLNKFKGSYGVNGSRLKESKFILLVNEGILWEINTKIPIKTNQVYFKKMINMALKRNYSVVKELKA